MARVFYTTVLREDCDPQVHFFRSLHDLELFKSLTKDESTYWSEGFESFIIPDSTGIPFSNPEDLQ